jgi:hypothetical protein
LFRQVEKTVLMSGALYTIFCLSMARKNSKNGDCYTEPWRRISSVK